ncbi:resuscitation-promoting factor [Kineosporia sp. A_224]|uniref:resuscitation-promoting factor n=1 Tax=Kineosporia sp. A_224 TaxID=1962180 RepID=UPI000B4B265D|nr:resuscitation-promoting factor [Kineosporia sp. A_224]
MRRDEDAPPVAVLGHRKVWSVVLNVLIGKPGKSRVLRLGAQAAVLTAVVGGTVAFANQDTDVDLTVDGRTTLVSEDADTVGELLAARGIRLGARDVVAPSPAAKIEDGDDVVVRYARQLEVSVDGKTQTFWTTELTVDSALRAVGIRADGARLSASRSLPLGRQGLALVVTTPKKVTLVADGKRAKVTTTAPTVGDLLTEQGLTLGKDDTLSVLQSTPTVKGLVVAVTRIDKKTVTKTEKVSYATKSVKSAKLYKGEKKVVTEGVQGSRTATYAVVLADGKVVSKKLVDATVTKKPVTQVVQVGTKARPASSSGGGGGGSVAGADSLNWAALAQCESGGNPSIVSSNGLYHGLYQFSVSTWRAVGGSGLPSQASSSEQTYRAKLLYKRAGAGQWPVCGRKLFT